MSSFRDQAPAGLRRVGRYELLRRLAIGGMGEIFLGRERGLAGVDRLVVVKLLLGELAEEPENVALFIDEARIAAQLAHPNIVQVYEFGEEEGAYFLAMEYIPGQNVARVCERAARQSVPYPRHSAVHVVAEMARGLDYAHKATDSRGNPMGIVHRDISPHNVLISTLGDVKLLDFGIAHASVRRQRTQTGVLRGKFGYMSPEQAEQAELDARSDVFCAGIVLWETTLMRRLFRGETELDTIRKVVCAEVPPPRSIDPSYPEDLEAAVMTALAADPNERFQSAGAMAAALRNVLTRRPRVEKDELGALVTTLFPETLPNDLSEVVRITAPLAAVTPMTVTRDLHASGSAAFAATLPSPAAAPAPAPAVSDATPAGDVAGSAGEGIDAEAAPMRSRRGLYMALLLGTAAAIALAVIVMQTRRSAPAATNDGPADAATEPVLDAGGQPSDAIVVVVTKPVDAGALAVDRAADAAVPRPRRPRTHPVVRRSPGPADAGAAQPAPTPARVDATLPVLPAPRVPGRLAVAARPYGRVTINGKAHGPTDLVERLPPGTYQVAVKMSDGSGTFRAAARVESNKKTKCQVANNALRCQSPR